MTREEIVGGLKLLEDNMVYFDELQNDKGEWIDVHELLFETIEALSQEPCDDAISREELLKAIETWDKFGCDANTRLVRYQDHYIPYIHYDNVIKCIKGMPSVTQKSGKCKTCKYWQDNNNGYPSDMCEWRTDETPDADDFCSGFEPQESEDKE